MDADKRTAGRKHRPAGQGVRVTWYRTGWLVACVTTLMVAASVPARLAAEDTPIERTPPRLSLLEGEVSFWRPGAGDWAPAQLNTPLGPGDALYAADGARFELQVGTRAYVRADGRTQLGIESQEPDFLQLTVTAGRAVLDAREILPGHTIEIDTPNAAFTIDDPGYYRIDVSEQTTAFIPRRGGLAQVRLAGGATSAIGTGDQVVVEGTDAPRLGTDTARALDDWDRWNYDRTDRLLAAKSWQYVPRGVYGADALDNYGTWSVVPTYGRVWVPRTVPADWAPYSTGRWVWDGYYGWTWVDDAPWGWAPYHYGRWVYASSYWAWAPGPIVVAPVYAPALVAFFGSGHFRVGVSVPFVSWVALGWGEPVVPWWGRAGFRGVPCWRGWGGPRIVNKVVVNHTKIVNINHVNAFENTRVRHAVVTVPRDRFGGRSISGVRQTGFDNRDARVLRGDVPVRPSPSSRVPAVGRTVRPPEAVRARRVVTARTPGDPRNRGATTTRPSVSGRTFPERDATRQRADVKAGEPRRVPPYVARREPPRGSTDERARRSAEVTRQTVEPPGPRVAERRAPRRPYEARGRERPPAPPDAAARRIPRVVQSDAPSRRAPTRQERRAPQLAANDRERDVGRAVAPQPPISRRPQRVEPPSPPARGGDVASVPPPRRRMEAAPSRESFSRPRQQEAPVGPRRLSRGFGSSASADVRGDNGTAARQQPSSGRARTFRSRSPQHR